MINKLWSLVLLSCVVTAFDPKVTVTNNDKVARELDYFDDSSHLLGLRDSTLVVSFDDGVTFADVKQAKDSEVIRLQFDPFNNKRAFALTHEKTQFITNDQGKSWSKFEILDSNGKSVRMDSSPKIKFNAKNNDLALLQFYNCPKGSDSFGPHCTHSHYYTTDGFKSNPELIGFDAKFCLFKKATKAFKDSGADETIVCSKDKLNSFGHVVESALYSSTDFKSTTKLNHEISKTGVIIDLRVEQNFFIAVIQNDKYNKKSTVSLLISKDGESFELSNLKIDVAYGIMSFLESSTLSIFVSVMDYSNHMHKYSLSTVYSSDSSGLNFSPVLDKLAGGAIRKVQTIDGAWLANIAIHESDDERNLLDLLVGGGVTKDVVSKYTHNDGLTWELLPVLDDPDCKVKDGCSLHLLTPSERDGSGKYVTGPTPGILLASGSQGKKLHSDFSSMSTYVSRDGGATWKLAIDEPCLFSFGDQGNIILALPYVGSDDTSTKDYYFSIDQGKSFEKRSLEYPIFPVTVTTTIDGTSKKFVVSGIQDEGKGNDDMHEVLYTFDFQGAFSGKVCSNNDLEEIYTRLDSNNEPVCVHGQKEKFQRRKQDAKCFINKLFEDVKSITEKCQCTIHDFECGPGFKLFEENCAPDVAKIQALCGKKKEITLPNKVIANGNVCELGKNTLNDFVVERKFKCSSLAEDDPTDKNSTQIVTKLNKFKGELHQYAYIEGGAGFGSDNIVLRTADKHAYVSNNGGVTFSRVPIHDKVAAFYTGEVPGHLILVTETKTIYVSNDGGSTFIKFEAPAPASLVSVAVTFHKTDPDQFLWYGSEGCENQFSSHCVVTAYYTIDGGRTFDVLKKSVGTCLYVGASLAEEGTKQDNDNIISCTVDRRPQRYLELVTSTNFFKDSKVEFDAVVGHAITAKYYVVAAVDTEKNSLKAKVSVSGSIFADADFPPDLKVEAQQAYTILESPTEAIFMHLTTSSEESMEYGSLLKSNSNGTFYALSLDKVNRNRVGYVDYDRIEGLEGVIVSNIVFLESGSKKLKTQITHNDGGEWLFLQPPAVNIDGNKYPCSGLSLEKCSLNIHGFTERPDYRDTYSSASAIGLMIGVGNVGETLESYDKASTFLTRDGGMTWKEIKKGVYMWEYGDRGTILVLVDAKEQTDTLSYSLDEGQTWKDYKFAESPVRIMDLATVPSDTARKFVIFAYLTQDRKSTLSFSIDFTGIFSRQCQLDLDNPDHDDFEYWTPTHPMLPDDCLFGHESRYLRRASGHEDCFIGAAPMLEGFKVIRNCSCTRRDYECDYNHFRDNDNTCKLVRGYTPTSRKDEDCVKPGAFEYFEPTGYRKIPISTCEGGKEFDKWDSKPCPGKEKEYNKEHGQEVKGAKLTMLVIVPLLVFVLATWFVYDRGIRRNGGFKRLGQIRLDEDDFQPIENNDVDKVINKIVKGGILAVAGTFAVFKTIKKLDRMLIERITSVIFRRAPGRRNYVLVPEIDEEEELFGSFHDNYEEELEAANQEFHDDVPEAELEEEADLGEVSVAAEPTNDRLFNIDDQSDEEVL